MDTELEGGLLVTASGEIRRGCEAECTDFPAKPLVVAGSPPSPAEYFGPPEDFAEPGPCVVEPQLSDGEVPGALFPANWLRPRFRFVPSGTENLFEIRIQAERQLNDLVVYTPHTAWTMPQETWRGLAMSSADEPITVTIRAVNTLSGKTPTGTRGTFTIAPVVARGKVIYFAATTSEVRPDTSWLAGFDVGDEASIEVLSIGDVGYRGILSGDGRNLRSAGYGTGAGEAQCIGCHTPTPDGSAVSFNDHWPWNVVVASIEEPDDSAVELGKAPDYLTLGAERLLNQPWLGIQTYSNAYWTSKQKLLVTSYGYPRRLDAYVGTVGFGWDVPERDTLAWFDLMTSVDMEVVDYDGDYATERNRLTAEALGEGFGLITLQGETLSASTPAWSSGGETIAYTAATHTKDGRLGANQIDVDIHMVPFNEGQGGAVEPLEGASDPNAAEYYPAYSSDDRLIIFNREDNFRVDKELEDHTPISGSGTIYYRPHAELYFVESEGGTPQRLLANDPPQCTGQTSPGIINSWGKWSPSVGYSSSFGPKRSYYWIVFTSARQYPDQFIVPISGFSPPDTRSSQLYMAAVIRDEYTGEYTSFPAIYLWNQETRSTNLTPAWNSLKTPPPVVK